MGPTFIDMTGPNGATLKSTDPSGAVRALDRDRADRERQRASKVEGNLHRVIKPQWDEYQARTSPERTRETLGRMQQAWSQPRPSGSTQAERVAKAHGDAMMGVERERAGGMVEAQRVAGDGAERVARVQGDVARHGVDAQAEGARAQRELDAEQADLERASREGMHTRELENSVERARLEVQKAQEAAAANSTATAAQQQHELERENIRANAKRRAGLADADAVEEQARIVADRIMPNVEKALQQFRTDRRLIGPNRPKAPTREDYDAFARSVGIRPDDATMLLTRLPDAGAEDVAMLVALMQSTGQSASDVLAWAERNFAAE
jgi:hypothetical protein